MNFDIVVTGNTFGSSIITFLINKNFNINLAHIIPEITIIKDIKLLIPSVVLKNLSIPFKIAIEKKLTSFNKINLLLLNKERELKNEKRIIISTSFEKLKKFLQTLTNNKNYKIFQDSIQEIFFNNEKFFIRLKNNKLITAYYLIVADDFWGNTWNLLGFKPQHTGGWIIKIPQTKKLKSKPFIAIGYQPKSVIISDQENIIFSKHIDKEYTIDNLINNFFLNNTIIQDITISDWNKYVLPFSIKEYEFPNEIKNKRIFFLTEYLGTISTLLPEYAHLTSLLAKELVEKIDDKIKKLDDFTSYINKIINYNKIFYKITDFINRFPLVFFENQDKDKLLTDMLIGNITIEELDNYFRQIFPNYDRKFEVVLSEQALKDS